MKLRHACAYVIAAATLLSAACTVKRSTYQKALTELSATNTELTDANRKLSEQDARIQKLETALSGARMSVGTGQTRAEGLQKETEVLRDMLITAHRRVEYLLTELKRSKRPPTVPPKTSRGRKALIVKQSARIRTLESELTRTQMELKVAQDKLQRRLKQQKRLKQRSKQVN